MSDCNGSICPNSATQKCEVCGKGICDGCSRLKSWARGCCSTRQARKSYRNEIALAKSEFWTMPEWMEEYRESFYSTGGNSIEDLMNALNDKTLSKTNGPLFTMAMMAQAQVGLLMKLYDAGKLR